MKFNEKIPRTIAKAVTWRLWMMITNSLIGWAVSGDPWKGVLVGLSTLVVNSILYVIHERLWNRADWAKEVKNADTVVDSALKTA